MGLEVIKYTPEHFETWDDFVLNKSYNGTIFHTRKFLSYHPSDRFEDHSILLQEKGNVIAVIAVAKKGKSYFSHPGTSGGGPVIHDKHRTTLKSKVIIETIIDYYEKSISFRIPESFFGKSSNANLIYLLSKDFNISYELAICLNLNFETDALSNVMRSTMRSSIRQQYKQGFHVSEAKTEEEYKAYYEILEQNLGDKHDASVTHSLEEFLSLKEIINGYETLFLGKDDQGNILGGIWVIKATCTVYHVQYIAKDYEKASAGSVPAILISAAQTCKDAGGKFFNIGLCTEERGSILNEGLADFKEALGGEGITRYIAEPK